MASGSDHLILTAGQKLAKKAHYGFSGQCVSMVTALAHATKGLGFDSW